MLSVTQKEAIFQKIVELLPLVIETKSFTPSVIYANQTIASYPTILLNYSEEEIKAQNNVGEYLGTPGSKGQRSFAWLSVNIYAKAAQGLNAFTVASGIASLLGNDMRENWGSITGGIKFVKKTQTKNLTGLFKEPGVDTARLQWDTYLLYDITW